MVRDSLSAMNSAAEDQWIRLKGGPEPVRYFPGCADALESGQYLRSQVTSLW